MVFRPLPVGASDTEGGLEEVKNHRLNRENDSMAHEALDGKDFNKQDSIDIRSCTCGSIHLSFFGRTTFHLSHEEFMKFSGGVAQLAVSLRRGRQRGALVTKNGNGLSH